jgi:serine/threonine protein kinase
MSDMWLCDRGHRGSLTGQDGTLRTLPTSCPVCGSAAVTLASLNGDGDGTLASDTAARLAIPAPSTVDKTHEVEPDQPTPDATIESSMQAPSTVDKTVQTDAPPDADDGLLRPPQAPDPLEILGQTVDLYGKVLPAAPDATVAHVEPPTTEETAVLADAGAAPSELDRTLDLLAPSTADHDPDKTAAEIDARTVALDAGVVVRGQGVKGRGDRTIPHTEQTVALGAPPASDTLDTVPASRVPSDSPEFTLRPKQGSRPKVPGLPAIAGYEVLSELGRGGMGVVYKARQAKLNRLVALKMILAANRASAKDLARFHIEAEAVAQLVHPNIVQLYEIGEREGCPFFSLEFVTGGTLADRAESKAQPPRRAARIVRELAQAMDFAHRRGIIHRDLKPANVLLSLPDDWSPPREGAPFPMDVCLPKITDFGLAKRLEGDGGQTRDGAIMGTPNYMAPEQARGKNKDVGPPADIYALGSILYDLLTGTPPFRGTTIMETLQQVVHHEPVPPRKRNALVPSDLSTICLKCLEKDPAKRYASAGDLAEDLRRYLEGEPISARPSSMLERGVKWARRRPTSAALVAVSVLAVIGMSAGGVAFGAREKQNAANEHALMTQADEQKNIAESERDRAERQRRRAEANFLDACAAVDELLARVGSQRLAHEPRMEKVRRELLHKAHQFYEKFLRESGDDPVVRWQAARSCLQLGEIERMLGETKEAEDHYRQALGLLGKLREQFPADARYRKDEAATHRNLGVLYGDLRRLDLAEAQHKAAQDLRRQLLAEESDNRDYLQALATSSADLGEIEFRRGLFPEAKQAFTEALSEMRGAAGSDARRQDVARVLNLLGQTLHVMGDSRDARAAFEEARDELQRLAADDKNKDVPEYREGLGVTFNNLGRLLRDTNPAEAEKAYDEALKLSQSLADDFPDTPFYRQELAANLNNLALLKQAAGHYDEAEKLYGRALAVKERLAADLPWAPVYRYQLAGALNNRGLELTTTGRPKEADDFYSRAVTILRDLLKEHPDTPDYEVELGKCLVNQAAAKLALGHAGDGEELAREGLDLHTNLAKKFRDVPGYRYELGRTQLNLGGLHELSKQLSQAKTDYHDALMTAAPLADQYRDEPDYALLAGLAASNLGDVLARLKQGKDAYAFWEVARERLRPLAERYPGVPVYRQHLAKSYNEYPKQLVADKKLKEAGEEWEKARALQEGLVKDFPLNAEYRADLARTLGNLVLVYMTANQFPTALDRFQALLTALEEDKARAGRDKSLRAASALATAFAQLDVDGKERLRAQERLVRLWQQFADGQGTAGNLAALAESQKLYGELLRDANRAGDARPPLEQAVANVRRAIPNPQTAEQRATLRAYSGALLELYQRLDDHAALARENDEWLKLFDKEPLPCVQAAARLAVCVTAAERDKALTGLERAVLELQYAESAMRHLKDAAGRGFKDAATLRTADEFAPLRERPDFKQLLATMEKK